MVITARFSSVCPSCHVSIAIGTSVEWSRGTKARHVDCTTASQAPTEPRRSAPASRYRSHYTRFSSGAEVFTNKRGRCEDAPCCGCCS